MNSAARLWLGLMLAVAPSMRADLAAVDRVLAPAPAGHYLNPEAFAWEKMLPPPPVMDSVAGRADLETVLHVQESRTAEQVAWAKFIEQDDVFKNARVLGGWFTRKNLPLTAEFFRRVDEDGAAATRGVKTIFPRRRPPFADARVRPCVEVPETGSYPSGHSSQAWMWAELLAEIFPDKRAELCERARAVMWGRVIGGAHFPTDTVGGQIVGEAVAAELLKNPAVRAEIERCRAEAQPFRLKKAA